MAVHMVALAAVHLTRGGGATSQVVGSLLWPYILRVCLSLRLAHQDVVTSSRLFLFQLSRIIALDDDHDDHDDHDQNHDDRNRPSHRTASSNRWDRALRLVRARAAQVRAVLAPANSTWSQEDEDSLHILSSLTL